MHKEKVDYSDITTITVPTRVRRKLGEVINHNENISEGLERILDREKKRLAKI